MVSPEENEDLTPGGGMCGYVCVVQAMFLCIGTNSRVFPNLVIPKHINLTILANRLAFANVLQYLCDYYSQLAMSENMPSALAKLDETIHILRTSRSLSTGPNKRLWLSAWEVIELLRDFVPACMWQPTASTREEEVELQAWSDGPYHQPGDLTLGDAKFLLSASAPFVHIRLTDEHFSLIRHWTTEALPFDALTLHAHRVSAAIHRYTKHNAAVDVLCLRGDFDLRTSKRIHMHAFQPVPMQPRRRIQSLQPQIELIIAALPRQGLAVFTLQELLPGKNLCEYVGGSHLTRE